MSTPSRTIKEHDQIMRDLVAATCNYFPPSEFHTNVQFSIQHLAYVINILHRPSGTAMTHSIDEVAVMHLSHDKLFDNVLDALAEQMQGHLASLGLGPRILLADQRPDPTCHPLGDLPRDYDEVADRQLIDGLISLAGFELMTRASKATGVKYYLFDRARRTAHPIASALLRKGSDYWKQILANFVSQRVTP